MKKVKETGIFINKPKTLLTSENIAAVAESVREAPSASIHRHSQQLKITETSLRQIWYDAIRSPIGSEVEAN